MSSFSPVQGSTQSLAQGIHEFVFRPFQEGTERLNRVWTGVNEHRIDRPFLSLKERTLSLLTGSLLLIPLWNVFFWTLLNTFSSPESLSEPWKDPFTEN